jgi:hypothetical protein
MSKPGLVDGILHGMERIASSVGRTLSFFENPGHGDPAYREELRDDEPTRRKEPSIDDAELGIAQQRSAMERLKRSVDEERQMEHR